MTAPRIDLLADHLDLAEQIAGWQWAEWGHLYPESSPRHWTRDLISRAGREIPFSLVAWLGSQPVGAVSLVDHDMPDDTAVASLSPCVSGTIVVKDARRQGVGTALMRGLESRAQSLGLTGIFLFTETAEEFYLRLGWRTIAYSQNRGSAAAVMERRLERGSSGRLR